MIPKTNHHICPQCPRKFASLKRMLTHVKKIHTTSIKKRRKRASSSGKGSKQRSQNQKRKPQPSSFVCGRCDFTTSRKRIYTAHMKSHLGESMEWNQEVKTESNPFRKPATSNGKRSSPDRNLSTAASTSASTLPLPTSPNYVPATSPGLYDFYHNGAGARQSGSGSSTYSNGSLGAPTECAMTRSGGIGHFILNRCTGASTNSTSSDPAQNNRPIRLDLVNQNSSGFEEMASCLQGLQQANGALMQLLRRRENELSSLRSNVLELLRFLLPNHQAFHNVLALDNIDDIVTSALNRVLTETTSQK